MKKHEEISRHAYGKSVFYRDYLNYNIDSDSEDFEFENLPIVTKDDMVSSKLPLEPVEYLLRDDVKAVKLSTSGTTGKILNIYWNKKDFLKSMTPLWLLRKKYYGINTYDKMCYFYTIRVNGSQENLELEGRSTLGFSKMYMSENRLKSIYRRMKEYEPKWMILQPSMAEMLLNTVTESGYSPIESVEYIEFSGEMLTENLKKRVEDFFGCKTANQYGSYEFNSIAYECPCGNMHIMTDNVYVEMDGEEFVITSLTNRRTPFIRYKIGDVGVINNHITCRCGNGSPVLELTVGRSSNYIECEDGNKINAYIFHGIIENVNYILDDVVKQFQVIQRGINDFLVRLYVDDRSLIDEIKKVFEKNIVEDSLKNAKFEFVMEKGYMNGESGEKLLFFKRD